MSLKNIFITARRLFFVPVCACCGERLSPFPEKGTYSHEKLCFCGDCNQKYHQAAVRECPSCLKNANQCICFPEYFKKHQEIIPSVCFYEPDSSSAPTKAILRMKKCRDAELFEFFTEELYPKIDEYLSKKGISLSDCIVTWMPRKKSSLNKYGFDHGQVLAKHIADKLDLPIYRLFNRVGGREQKKLDRTERSYNASKSIILNEKMRGFSKADKRLGLTGFLADKHVIVIDDVITTGATFKRGVMLLKPLDPASITIACIAKTPKNIKKIPTAKD